MVFIWISWVARGVSGEVLETSLENLEQAGIVIWRQRGLKLLGADGESVSDQREILGTTVERLEETEQLPEIADPAAIDPLQDLTDQGILESPRPDRHLESRLEDLGQMFGQAAVSIGEVSADPTGLDEPAGQSLLPRLEEIMGELLAAAEVMVEGALGDTEATGQSVDGERPGAIGFE
jgi:hypothetical protein